MNNINGNIINLLSNVKSKYINYTNFVDSFNTVFGDNINTQYNNTNLFFEKYEINPSENIYINIKSLRQKMIEIVQQYKNNLESLSTVIYNQSDISKYKAPDFPKQHYNNILKQIDNNKDKICTEDVFNKLKVNVTKYLSLYNNIDINSNSESNIIDMLTFATYKTYSSYNSYLDDLMTKIKTYNYEVEEEYYTNKTKQNTDINTYTNLQTTVTLNFDSFYAQMQKIEQESKDIINSLYKQDYKYRIYSNNELEVIFKTNTNRSDNDKFLNEFDKLVTLNKAGFDPIQEHINNIINGSHLTSKFNINNIFEITNINFKNKGELLMVLTQENDSLKVNNTISFNVSIIDNFTDKSINGKYLKHTEGNNSYFTIVNFNTTNITIECNKDISFTDGDIYSVYDDYNLDNNNFLTNLKNEIYNKEKQINSIANDIINKSNNILYKIVKDYFKLMFKEKGIVYDILGNKIDKFYIGGEKIHEIIKLTQSAFSIVRPPIVQGDYGDKQGLGGERYSDTGDPTDEYKDNVYIKQDKYPIGEAYVIFDVINTFIDWYNDIAKLLLSIYGIKFNVDDLDVNILNEYITGYKNPLSLSVLSPVIKIIRSFINKSITSAINWVNGNIKQIDDKISYLNKTEEEIKALINKKAFEILIQDTIDLDDELRKTLGNNLFSEQTIIKAKSLLQENINESVNFLKDELNKKINNGTYLTKLVKKYSDEIKIIVITGVLSVIITKITYNILRAGITFIDNIISYLINVLIANIESNLIQDSNEELIISYNKFKQLILNKSTPDIQQNYDNIGELLNKYNNTQTETEKLNIINKANKEINNISDFSDLDIMYNNVLNNNKSFNDRMKNRALKVYKTNDFSTLFNDKNSNKLTKEFEEKLLLITTLITLSYKEYLINKDLILFKDEMIIFKTILTELHTNFISIKQQLSLLDYTSLLITNDIIDNIKLNTLDDISNGISDINANTNNNYRIDVIKYTLYKVTNILTLIKNEEDNNIINIIVNNINKIIQNNFETIIDKIIKNVIQDKLLLNLQTDKTQNINITIADGGYISLKKFNLISKNDITNFDKNKLNDSIVYYITKNNIKNNVVFINDTDYIPILYNIGDYILLNNKNILHNNTNNTNNIDNIYTDTCDNSKNVNTNSNDVNNFFDDNEYRLSYVLPDINALFKFDWIIKYVEEFSKVIGKLANELDKPEKFYEMWVNKNLNTHIENIENNTNVACNIIKQAMNNYNFDDNMSNVCKVLQNYNSVDDIKKELNKEGIPINMDTNNLINEIKNQGLHSNYDDTSKQKLTDKSKDTINKFIDKNGSINQDLITKIGIVLLQEQTNNAILPDGVKRNKDNSLSLKILPLEGDQSYVTYKPMNYFDICKARKKYQNADLTNLGDLLEADINKAIQQYLPTYLQNDMKKILITNPKNKVDISNQNYCI